MKRAALFAFFVLALVDSGLSRAADALKIAPVYIVWSGEMMLDAPVEKAWPHVMDYPSWQSYPVVRHISGEPGQEGEVVLLKKGEESFDFPAYYARTVQLDPGRKVIWKIYPQAASPDMNFFGFCEFRAQDVQGKTRFEYNLIYEFQVPYRELSELEAFRTKQYANFAGLFAVILPNLRKLVQQAP